MSQNIPDKIIKHLVSEYFLVEVFDKTLIDENIATRKNKGTHIGIEKLKQYLKKHIKEDLYILKFDVTKYFFNLDHDIIKQIIRSKIKDKDAINILDRIIDSTDCEYINRQIENIKAKEITKLEKSSASNKDKLINDIKNIPLCKKGKFAPIGNMSSQAFAIIYLNELDNYIKKVLKPSLYIRYQDDGLLISNSKEYLKECLLKINKIIIKYKLKLNNKTRIYKIDEGFDFLGFKYIRKNDRLIVKVKNQTKRKFKRKMKVLYKLYQEKKIDLKDVNQVKSSYLGHLKYGNTKNLINSTLIRYAKVLDENLGNWVIID